MFEKIEGSLKQVLNEMHVNEGDILYVSSDIKTLLFSWAMESGIKAKEERNKALNELVDAFQLIVGDKGTLLFPVFSWDWCRGNGFDVKHTQGEVGTLSNWVLANRKEFVRTKHPMYSFMVWGKDAEYLRNMDNQDGWSRSSPFYYLQTHKAKQLLFNIEAFQGLTFGHYVEQEVGVPYRHPKYFFGEYTDEEGIKETRMYSMYVRDMDLAVGCGIHNDWLIDHQVAWRKEWEGNLLTVVDLEKSYPVIRDDMLHNNGRNTVAFAEGGLDWSKKQTLPYEVKGIEV